MLWKIWVEDFPDLSDSCEFMSPTNMFFLVGCQSKCGLWEIWNGFLTLLHQKQNVCHLRIVCPVSHMKIYSKYSPEVHQSKQCINFNSVCFFDSCVLADSLKLSLHCKCAIVSFILVFVQAAIFSMISLSKYKWKVSSIFSILFALEFGARQFILPEMVSYFRCLPVDTGCSQLHQILFVFLSLFGPR